MLCSEDGCSDTAYSFYKCGCSKRRRRPEMEEINRAPPHAPLVFPRAFIIFCWSTCTVNVRNKERGHTGRGPRLFGSPDARRTMQHRSEIQPGLKPGESIADYISCFGIDPSNKMGRINAKLQAISLFIFISFTATPKTLCGVQKRARWRFLFPFSRRSYRLTSISA